MATNNSENLPQYKELRNAAEGMIKEVRDLATDYEMEVSEVIEIYNLTMARDRMVLMDAMAEVAYQIINNRMDFFSPPDMPRPEAQA